MSGGALINVGDTGMFPPTGSSFSSPNSNPGYPVWPWTLGPGIIFAFKYCFYANTTFERSKFAVSIIIFGKSV